MNRFAEQLRMIDGMLDIPQPSRSRVILEISADMEDLYEHYIGQGLGGEEAVKRTIEEFDISAESIDAIAEVHDSPLKRFLDRFSAGTRSALERTALSVTMIPVVILALMLSRSGGMFGYSGIWKWPLLFGVVVAVALGTTKWYRLFVLKDHNIRAVRKRLNAAIYISLGQLATGFIGMYFDLFQTWMKSSSDKVRTIMYLAHWLQRSSALLSTAMIAAIMSGLIWIVTSGKAASIEQHEAELILDSEGESP